MSTLYVILLIGFVALYGVNADGHDSGLDDNEVFGPQIPVKHDRRRRQASVQDVKSSFGRVQQKMNSANGVTPGVQNTLKSLNTKVNNLTAKTVGEHVNQLLKVATKIEDNWTGLSSNDGPTIAKSVIDIIGSVGGLLPPPAGEIISGFTGLISFFISIFGGAPSQQDLGKIINDIINQQLKQQYLTEIHDELAGATEKLDQIQHFLNDYIGYQLSSGDLSVLVSNAHVFENEELRGKIANIIKRMSKTSKDDDAKDAVSLVNSYVLITSMREVLMHTMLQVFTEQKLAVSVNAINNTIYRSQGTSKETLAFLRKPAQENAITVANYVPNNNPGIEVFLEGIGVTFPDINLGGCFRMTSRRFGTHVAVLPTGFTLTIKDAGRSTPLRFERSGNTWIISAPSGKFGFVDSRSGRLGNRINIVQNAEQFRIYKFTDGSYMFINEKWPTQPMFSHNIANLMVGCCQLDGAPEYVYDLVSRGC